MSECKAVNGVGNSFVDKDGLWDFCHCPSCERIAELEQQLAELEQQLTGLREALSWAVRCLPANDWKDDMPEAIEKLSAAKALLKQEKQ